MPRQTSSGGRRPKTSRRASYHHGDLRSALVQAATQLVEEFGTQGVSLREAARRCGVSQAAPYRHFASREALLAAVAAEGFRRFAHTLETHAGDAADPIVRLKALGRGYVAFAMQHPEILRLMFGPECAKCADAELEAAANAAYRLLAETVATALERPGAPAVERPVATLGAWSLVHGLARLQIDMAGEPPDLAGMDPAARAALVIDTFIDALMHHQGTGRASE